MPIVTEDKGGAAPRRVLVVDHDLFYARSLAREFQENNFVAQIATTFDQAVAAVAAETPDLTVLDIYLGNRSCVELLRVWKKAAPEMVVVLISGNPSLALAIDAMKEGGTGYFTKPVTVGAILQELAHKTAPDASSSPLAIATDHRLSSDALHAEGVDRFFDISPGLLCVSGFDGYFKMLNPAWEKTLGYSIAELCAKPHLELVHPDDREKAFDEAVQIRGGRAIFYYRNRYRRKDGSYKWLAWNASPSRPHQLIYASANDITAAVAVEDELRAKASRLRAVAEIREQKLDTVAAKNEALAELGMFKDEMSGLIVHDLKNPLAVIISNYDYIAEGLKDHPKCMEALEDSRNASRRMLRLLANLYDVTRLEENRLEVNRLPTNVSRLFCDIADQRRVIGQARRITIETIGPTDTTMQVDADLLTRTAENIVDNALRYTPSGGRIEIEVRDTGDNVEARIGNTGLAIPVEHRNLIFKKCHQVSQRTAHMNLGLGLYFCRLAIEAQGGKIWVEETERLATVFAIQLPRHPAASVA